MNLKAESQWFLSCTDLSSNVFTWMTLCNYTMTNTPFIWKEKKEKTRKSCCVNARSIPPRRIASTHYAVPYGGTPRTWLGKRVPLSQVWMRGYPIPGLDGGYPFPSLDGGIPPSQVWMGGTPIRKDGVPPPYPVEVWTDKQTHNILNCTIPYII